jgi:MFS family permease
MPTALSQTSLDVRRRNAVKGAFWCEFIDMFDIYLPVVVLAPVMELFQPPRVSADSASILISLVFVTTLFGRPVGAILFGLAADRIGRRKASIYSASGFGIVTLAIAALPTYQSVGMASYWMLVLLRFVDGIFIGGSYTGAMPLAMEYSKKSERGYVGGLIIAGFCAAYLCINLVMLGMLKLAPLQGMHSAYAIWGWRVPFVIGGALAGMLAYYYVHNVSEPEVWQAETGGRARTPVSDLLRGDGAAKLAQVLLLMTGFWLTQNLMTLYLPTLLRQVLHLEGIKVTLTLMTAYTLLFFSYIGSGVLAQRIGRRRFFMAIGLLIATIGSLLLYLLTTLRGQSLTTTMLLVCATTILVTAPWGVIVTYLNERFATDVRATAFGVGFSLSVVIPSFYAFYLQWLGRWIPPYLAPVALLALGGLLGAIGAWAGPETKDADF